MRRRYVGFQKVLGTIRPRNRPRPPEVSSYRLLMAAVGLWTLACVLAAMWFLAHP